MVHSMQNMQNSIALRLLWEAPDGSANQNVYPLIPLTHPPDLAHRHTQLCLMAIVRAEVAVFKWDNGWLRYTDPKWQPASMRCIPAKTRLPDDIFRGAGRRPVPVAVQLPKSPWWPPLAEYIFNTWGSINHSYNGEENTLLLKKKWYKPHKDMSALHHK